MQMPEIAIWTMPECGWCFKAKKLMEALDWDYVEHKGKHPNWKTVPYIEINNQPVGGFTEFSKYVRSLSSS